jgi:hypothetical protein
MVSTWKIIVRLRAGLFRPVQLQQSLRRVDHQASQLRADLDADGPREGDPHRAAAGAALRLHLQHNGSAEILPSGHSAHAGAGAAVEDRTAGQVRQIKLVFGQRRQFRAGNHSFAAGKAARRID